MYLPTAARGRAGEWACIRPGFRTHVLGQRCRAGDPGLRLPAVPIKGNRSMLLREFGHLRSMRISVFRRETFDFGLGDPNWIWSPSSTRCGP